MIVKSAGEENLYVWFVYRQKKNFNHIGGQLSGSMKADLINLNNNSATNDAKIETKTPTDITLKYDVGQRSTSEESTFEK